jgi:hypothetical protein
MDRQEPADPLLDDLRSSRPEMQPSELSPTSPRAVRMMEEIVALPASVVSNPPPRRFRSAIRWSAAGAVALLLAVAVWQTGGSRAGQSGPPDAGAAILRIASTSEQALGGSGRARIVFRQEGLPGTSEGVTNLTFSRDDLDMVIDFAGQEGRPGFQAQNRTVDGQFYLLDGPPGQKEWIRDTNSTQLKGTDFFNLDPRTLIGALAPQVGFEEIDAEDGLRHFRAANPDRLAKLSLGDPVDPKSITSLDVWAGADNVVTRMVLATSRTETARPGARAILVENPDGTRSKIIDPADTTPEVTRTIRSTYQVEFTDLGVPVEIKAPEGARDLGLVG